MSRKEKIQSFIGIFVTIVILVIVGKVVMADDRFPRLIFWLAAEIFLFADGCAVYNMCTQKLP